MAITYGDLENFQNGNGPTINAQNYLKSHHIDHRHGQSVALAECIQFTVVSSCRLSMRDNT